MVPLLAATSAVSAVSDVAESAVTAWQDMVASRSNSKAAAQGVSQGAGGPAADSFSALLSAQGVGAASAGGASQAGALQGAGLHGMGHHDGHRHLDRSA